MHNHSKRESDQRNVNYIASHYRPWMAVAWTRSLDLIRFNQNVLCYVAKCDNSWYIFLCKPEHILGRNFPHCQCPYDRKLKSSSRSNWTGIWNGSWTDRQSFHFSTVKRWVLKLHSFSNKNHNKQILKWCWNVDEILLNLQMMKWLESQF